MANQQGKKTQPGQAAGQGNNPSSTGQVAGAVPASGQDRPQNTPRTSSMGSTPSSTANTGAATRPTVSDNQPVSEKLSSTANGILDKAKETASGTYDAVASKATTKIEERKGELSTGLKTLADTFRKTGTDLEGAQSTTPLTDLTAKYTGSAANQIEKVASYFERKDLRMMMRDVEGYARRNPAIFLGAAFGLGLIAARFLKSSPPERGTAAGTGTLNTGLQNALPSGTERANPAPTNP